MELIEKQLWQIEHDNLLVQGKELLNLLAKYVQTFLDGQRQSLLGLIVLNDDDVGNGLKQVLEL